MKFTENCLVVDVIKISNSSYKLSVPAGDLLTAAMNGAVLRRHDLSTAAVPNVLYVPLSEAKLQSGAYTFTFASGDAFTASAADAYPTASSVSDKTDSELPSVGTSDKNKFLHTNESTGALEWAEGGSSGAEDFVVTFSGTTSEENAAVDKTLQEINEAFIAGKTIKLRYMTSDDDGGGIFELLKGYWTNDGRITFLIGAYSDHDRRDIHCTLDNNGNLFITYQEH